MSLVVPTLCESHHGHLTEIRLFDSRQTRIAFRKGSYGNEPGELSVQKSRWHWDHTLESM